MTKKLIFKKILSGVILLFLFLPVTMLAQQNPPTPNPGNPPTPIPKSTPFNIEIKNPFSGGNDLEAFIKTVINKLVLPIGGVVAVLMIMYAGFMYVTAGGNETKIKNAHNALLYAAIGSAILLGAWVISEAIGGTIGQLRK